MRYHQERGKRRGGLTSPVPRNILQTSPGVETKLRSVFPPAPPRHPPRGASLPPCSCRDAAPWGGSLGAPDIVGPLCRSLLPCWTYGWASAVLLFSSPKARRWDIRHGESVGGGGDHGRYWVGWWRERERTDARAFLRSRWTSRRPNLEGNYGEKKVWAHYEWN